jgi:glycerophosphoryl diester phosphodiesterase
MSTHIFFGGYRTLIALLGLGAVAILGQTWRHVHSSTPSWRAHKRAEKSWKNLKVIAHRGTNKDSPEETAAPENSLRAFRKALETADGIEVDVQITADNKLIVMHDALVDRTAVTATGRVREKTQAELRELDVSGVIGAGDAPPLLEEVRA